MKNYKHAFILTVIAACTVPTLALADSGSQDALDSQVPTLHNSGQQGLVTPGADVPNNLEEIREHERADVKSVPLAPPRRTHRKVRSRKAHAASQKPATHLKADDGDQYQYTQWVPGTEPGYKKLQVCSGSGHCKDIDNGNDSSFQFTQDAVDRCNKFYGDHIPSPAQSVRQSGSLTALSKQLMDCQSFSAHTAVVPNQIPEGSYTYTQWAKGTSPGHFILQACSKDHCENVPNTQEYTRQEINTCNDNSKKQYGAPMIGVGLPPSGKEAQTRGLPVDGKVGVTKDLASNLDLCKRLLEVKADENDVYDYTQWEKGSKSNQFKLVACAKDKSCKQVLDTKEFTRSDILSCNKHIFPSYNGGDNLIGVNLPPERSSDLSTQKRGEMLLEKSGSVKDLANRMLACAQSEKSSEDSSASLGQHPPTQVQQQRSNIAQTNQKGFLNTIFGSNDDGKTEQAQTPSDKNDYRGIAPAL